MKESNFFPLNYQSEIVYVKNKLITEYDIKSGGYSITLSENLIDNDEIVEALNKATKKERQILLGKYTLKDKDFSERLHQGFRKYVYGFITLNRIDRHNVLRIAKDSVLFYGTTDKIERTKLKKAEFTQRGSWTSYLALGKIIFLYDSKTNTHEIRGLGENYPYEKTLLEVVIYLMKINEVDPQETVRALKEFREEYLRRNVDIGYYREIKPEMQYCLSPEYSLLSNKVYLDSLTDNDIEMVDIVYNYVNIIAPLCRYLI